MRYLLESQKLRYEFCWIACHDFVFSMLDADLTISLVPEKAVYVKDDFFDSLSCNQIDNGGRNGRVKFSEQRKIDTEVFTDRH
jgi:hypothetical protein